MIAKKIIIFIFLALNLLPVSQIRAYVAPNLPVLPNLPTVPISQPAIEAKETGINVSLFGVNFKLPFSWDSIAITLVKQILERTVDSTVDWINGGFDGNPAYVDNPKKYFADIADGVLGDFIYGSDLSYLCSPFQTQVRLALLKQYNQPQQFQCTLTGAVANIEAFYSDFSQGGWDGWFAMTQNNANNPYGAYLEAQIELDSRIAASVGLKKEQLDWGRGFLSYEKCPEGQELDPSAGTGDCKVEKKIVTPGSAIESQLQNVLGSGIRQLELADEFDELIAALLGELLNRSVFSNDGLAGTPKVYGTGGSAGSVRGGGVVLRDTRACILEEFDFRDQIENWPGELDEMAYFSATIRIRGQYETGEVLRNMAWQTALELDRQISASGSSDFDASSGQTPPGAFGTLQNLRTELNKFHQMYMEVIAGNVLIDGEGNVVRTLYSNAQIDAQRDKIKTIMNALLATPNCETIDTLPETAPTTNGGIPPSGTIGGGTIPGSNGSGNDTGAPSTINTSNVVWLDSSEVGNWSVTSNLSVNFNSSGQVCFNYDKSSVWPNIITSANTTGVPDLNGNVWVVVWRNGAWQAETFEWTRQSSSVCKNPLAVRGIEVSPGAMRIDPLRDFRPIPGETYGFMASCVARDDNRNCSERTNITMVKWPGTQANSGGGGATSLRSQIDAALATYPPSDFNNCSGEGVEPATCPSGYILNSVAWNNRSLGWGLSGKTSGHRCPSPAGYIACDILHYQPTNTLYDVFTGTGGSESVWLNQGAPQSSDRPFVAPTQT